MERERGKDFEIFVRKYRVIGLLLIKMEGFVVYINFGRFFKLSVYYFYWEKKVYDVLIKLIMCNLRRFEVALRISKFLF